MSRINLKILFFLSAAIVFWPAATLAKIVPDCAGPPAGACGLCDFFQLIANIFNFIAFSLAPPLGAALFIAAGLLFILSGGSQSRVGQAKKIFINTFIGLIFVYGSWLLVNTLIMTIAKDVDNFKKENWNKFNCSGGAMIDSQKELASVLPSDFIINSQ